MHIASLLVFNIYLRLMNDRARRHLCVVYREKNDALDDVLRMTASWTEKIAITTSSLEDCLAGSNAIGNVLYAVLSDDNRIGNQLEDRFPGSVIRPIVPELESFEFGLFREFEAHDYEIGGLNEWNGEPSIYGPFVLRSLSVVHCRDRFPGYIDDELTELRQRFGTPLTALDVGCGPISVLRAGALSGQLSIVGIDPLNDLYDAILARHGLDGLPEIRPATKIAGFMEDVDFGAKLFPFIFSCNALDHTQDLLGSVRKIAEVLHPDGLALIIVNTREGTRNNFEGLHKYDIWCDGNAVLYSTNGGQVRNLLSEIPTLILSRVVFSTDEQLCVLIRHRPAVA